jgi:hypothetical protein
MDRRRSQHRRQVLAKVMPLTIMRPPLVEYPSFVTDDGQGIQEALADGQSPLDSYRSWPIASISRSSWSSQNQGDSRDISRRATRVSLRAVRGRATFDEELRPVLRLDRDGISSSSTRRSIWPTSSSKVVVKGRHRDAAGQKGDATCAILLDELQIDPSVDFPLMSGPELREQWFGGTKTSSPCRISRTTRSAPIGPRRP